MAKHIPVVAILMIIQGSLELILGGLLTVAALFFPTFIATVLQQNPAFAKGQGPADVEAVVKLALIFYLGMGAAGLIAGLLHLIAGIRNVTYGGRVMGLVALIGGLASIATCYCAPTTIALAVYGLIVYFNAESVRAFQLGQQGMSSRAIRDALARGALPPAEEAPLEFRLPEERPRGERPAERPPTEQRPPPEDGIKPPGGS
jgi:hypothetical protein